MLQHEVLVVLTHVMKNQHEHVLSHPLELSKIFGACCVAGKVVSVEHLMILHPLHGLRFLSSKLRTSTPCSLLLLGAVHFLEMNED
jgi:hypothetical protein